MAHLEPTDQQLAAFAAEPQDGPIVMLNLLRFKGAEGRASYQRYIELATPLVASAGGRRIYAGQGVLALIGPRSWDMVLLIEYPDRAALLAMLASSEYRAISHHRQEALEDSRLILTRALPG
jgi:uncharacterized protein (DUF1330 family)